jgi:alkylated DNA repair dioxygenase AlkB
MYQQLNLWDCPESIPVENKIIGKNILSQDGEVILYSQFFTIEESDSFLEDLQKNINWKQEYIKLYGKLMPIPRLSAWYGDEGKSYTYSRIEQHPNPWTPTLNSIKARVESLIEVCFNSVLLNLYRDGSDSVAWHSDDEAELGKNPIIASVSFGAVRRFCFKHKTRDNHKLEIELSHGSLVIMKGETQHHWLHQVPKTKQNVYPRINLTFRVIR